MGSFDAWDPGFVAGMFIGAVLVLIAIHWPSKGDRYDKEIHP